MTTNVKPINKCEKCGCEILAGDRLCIRCYKKRKTIIITAYSVIWMATAVLTDIFFGVSVTFGWAFSFILLPFIVKKDRYITKRWMFNSMPHSLDELVDEFRGDPEIEAVCRFKYDLPEERKVDDYYLSNFIEYKIIKNLKKSKSNILSDYLDSQGTPSAVCEAYDTKPVSYKMPFIALTVALAVILALIVFLNAEHRNEIQKSESAYTKLEMKYEVLNNKYTDLFKKNEELQVKYNKIINEYEFYEYYAVCVNEESPYYHNYSCDKFESSSFWIYNIEAAKGRGYDPCPKCRLNEQ